MPGRRIALVDLAARREVGSWSTGLRFANYPLAYAEGVVAAVFRMPARLVVLEAATGRIRADLGACGDSDAAHFDTRRRRLYVTCGAGVVEVFAQDGCAYRTLGRVKTKPGARIGLYVPELDRLFVAAPARNGAGATIIILRPKTPS